MCRELLKFEALPPQRFFSTARRRSQTCFLFPSSSCSAVSVADQGARELDGHLRMSGDYVESALSRSSSRSASLILKDAYRPERRRGLCTTAKVKGTMKAPRWRCGLD